MCLHTSELVYLIVAKEFSGEEEVVHLKLKALLEEFSDVFLEETPKELPTINGIEHQIDLISG